MDDTDMHAARLDPRPPATPPSRPTPVFRAARKQAHGLRGMRRDGSFQHVVAGVPARPDRPEHGGFHVGSSRSPCATPTGSTQVAMDRTAVAAAAGRPHKKPRTLSYTIVDCLQDPSQPLSQIDEALVEIDCRHASTEAPRLMGDPGVAVAGVAVADTRAVSAV